MRYFYEYKYKSGNRMVGGHNLENIIMRDNKIILKGVDIMPTYYDEEYKNKDLKNEVIELLRDLKDSYDCE